MTFKYIYILEDNSIVQSDEAPTLADLAAIDDGILSVIRVEIDLHVEITENLGDDIWSSISQAKTCENEEGQPYHDYTRDEELD